MVKIEFEDLISSLIDGNFLWLIIPIFFIGIITDKYQEEFGTSIGNAISNGALIIYTGFSWLEIIFSREHFPLEATISQFLFACFIVIYGLMIIFSGFNNEQFAKKYGRIRVITFMLIFFTMMIYIPLLYNFVSIILFVLLFPFYYAFITELIKVMPNPRGVNFNHDIKDNYIDLSSLSKKNKIITIGKMKFKEYLK